jgi:soluble lytic murein transglycosylase
MLSMGKDPRTTWRIPAVLLLGALGSSGINASGPQDDAAAINWQAVAGRIDASGAEDRRVAAAVDRWRALTKSETAGFTAYSDFLIQYPGWPDDSRMRNLAERSVNADIDSPSAIVAFFGRYPARTAQGHAAHALAQAKLGRMESARAAAREAWIAGALPLPLEQALTAQFSGSFTPADHLLRADALLWRRSTDAAERVLGFVPVTRQAVIAARIAMQRKAADAALKVAAADPVGAMDAGYLTDKARWLSETGDESGARRLLANRLPLGQMPPNAELWYEAMLTRARAASRDGDWATAYAIASKVDDAHAPGTDITAQPLGVRDDYTTLTWLAGTTAFQQLKRYADAEAMFARYASGGQGASIKAKGHYWAGRSALAQGRKTEAQAYFEQAAAFSDQFYGQLALERLGRPMVAPRTQTAQVALSTADRSTFNNQPIVRAALLLGQQGAWGDQSKFVRTIATSATTARDHALSAELARTLGRPDLGIMAGRRATVSGVSGYDRASFPHMNVPESERDNWTMIHAISRQESQFDRAIVSHAGARGLMQLMPATAREQAGKVGLSYNLGSLFEPDYNIRLGSTYFMRLLSYYNGSYPLAIAAYNGGMGNVNKWLKANGDPRLPGADMLQWIEQIPIYETRDYVQRVLENAVVYDLVNPMKDGARPQSAAPLSRYLGKREPG